MTWNIPFLYICSKDQVQLIAVFRSMRGGILLLRLEPNMFNAPSSNQGANVSYSTTLRGSNNQVSTTCEVEHAHYHGGCRPLYSFRPQHLLRHSLISVNHNIPSATYTLLDHLQESPCPTTIHLTRPHWRQFALNPLLSSLTA